MCDRSFNSAACGLLYLTENVSRNDYHLVSVFRQRKAAQQGIYERERMIMRTRCLVM